MTIPSMNLDSLHEFNFKFGGKQMAVCNDNGWSGKTIKLVYDDGKCYQYINGTLNKTYNNIPEPSARLRWEIWHNRLAPSSNTSSMTISDLKIYNIRE